MATIYDFELPGLTGKPLSLAEFRGRPILLVNTASKCGFTPQYAGLQALWEAHKDEGLVVLGVPSNDFASQEPGSADEIASFCEINYGVGFPMAGKQHVKGAAAHPLFKWVAGEGGFLSRPRWNFYKYLIGTDGHLANWFSSLTKPDSDRFKKAVDAIIPG
ncbi:MAG: glutathione peroxidase [Parvibaculaceae bacterium]|nr:glutathione peroxidase [Parvibaculaceae bacterium]